MTKEEIREVIECFKAEIRLCDRALEHYGKDCEKEVLKGKWCYEMAIKALEQEPCEDAIGRSDMLDAIGHGTTYTSKELQRIIKGLPPVNPQPKMDLSELKRRILMEVDGGTDDRMLRYCDVCDRISDSIDKYQAESEE